MIPHNQHLNPNIFTPDLPLEPTRNGFGRGLVDAGKKDENIVALCADLAESTRMQWFQETFPDRYVEIGVAEQNLATVGAGMAAAGKIPFIASYATFNPGRNWEQIRTTICLNETNVKIVGSHAGISVGPDGATHQALEDIAITRVLPHMTVLVPADSNEAYKATHAAATHDGPVYIRLAREKAPVFTTDETPFEIGKAQVVWQSEDPAVTIIACGDMVYQALQAAKALEHQVDTTVINLATIKPLDSTTILEHVKKSGQVITIEEHQIAGGMGSAVAELLAQELPKPITFIGIHDRFGQSGNKEELYTEYGLDIENIKNVIKNVAS
ncbi:transketolase family protein [Candidatus Nomurabacteria bacterium]|nr:transketolase family protein [Candidatus Nomurabacteria bacterium]